MTWRMFLCCVATVAPAAGQAQASKEAEAAADIVAVMGSTPHSRGEELEIRNRRVFGLLKARTVDPLAVMNRITPMRLPLPEGVRYHAACSAELSSVREELVVLFTFNQEISPYWKRHRDRLASGQAFSPDPKPVSRNAVADRTYDGMERFLVAKGFRSEVHGTGEIAIATSDYIGDYRLVAEPRAYLDLEPPTIANTYGMKIMMHGRPFGDGCSDLPSGPVLSYRLRNKAG